jgi:putative tricarboxylic transport membrane protein
MRNKRDMIFAVVLVPLGIAVIIGALRLKLGTPLHPGAGFFPFLIGIVLIALSILLFMRAWLRGGRAHQPYSEWKQASIVVAAQALYVATLESLGYVFSATLLSFAVLRSMEVRSWKALIWATLILSVGAYVLFRYFLGVDLPPGLLEFLH